MNIPSSEYWIDMREAAKKMKTSQWVANACRRDGRKSASGETVYLKCWRCTSGWITTAEEVERFIRRLNG